MRASTIPRRAQLDGRRPGAHRRPGSGDLCDPDESCTGEADAACPADIVSPLTTICNPGSGDICDPDESCTGNPWDACPNDTIASPTTICRPAQTPDPACDLDESCTGVADAECPADRLAPPFTPCGDPSDTECTEPDECDGNGVCLPNNEACAFVTSSALCAFDIQPDKGMCTLSPEACLFDFEACEAAGGTICADGICQNADGEDLDPIIECSDGCAADDDYCEQSGQFRLLFTPDVKNWVGYKLNASNPGQTFYNLFYEGDPGDNVTLQITVPYPYVTVGGTPIHVYDGDLGVTGEEETCEGQQFLPPEETLAESQVQISLQDWIDGGTNNLDLTCTAPVCEPLGALATPAPPDESCSFDVQVTIPDSGIVYVNAHLDYGLKGPQKDALPLR